MSTNRKCIQHNCNLMAKPWNPRCTKHAICLFRNCRKIQKARGFCKEHDVCQYPGCKAAPKVKSFCRFHAAAGTAFKGKLPYLSRAEQLKTVKNMANHLILSRSSAIGGLNSSSATGPLSAKSPEKKRAQVLLGTPTKGTNRKSTIPKKGVINV